MNTRIDTPQLARRDWLKLSAAGLISGVTVPWFEALANDAATQARRPNKACILLWMDGGPSQAHTFDPKAGGEFQTISTAVPGIQLVEQLPRLAGLMDDLALVRGMSTGEGEHYRAKYQMHTGYKRLGSFEHPALGSIASHELGDPTCDLPAFVTIDAGFDKTNGGRLYRNVPAYLGPKHAPLAVRDPESGLENLSTTIAESQVEQRLELLGRAEKRFASEYPSPIVAAKQAAFDRAVSLMRSRQAKVFDVSTEPAAIREAYGSHKFGQSCLMARRLIESGTRFVEVFHRGWDDHGGAAKEHAKRCEWMDPAMATLITDLKARGLFETTLVVWMGEFGRSPIKGDGHYARAWSTVLAGAGLKTGQAIGKTNDDGKSPGGTVEDRPVSVPDFFATICRAMEIDPAREFHAAGERPMRLVDKSGKAIEELF